MIIYIDVSALIKEFHTEEGTEIVSFVFENLRGNIAITSLLSISEFISAFRRKLKADVINKEEYEIAISSFLKEMLDEFILGNIDNQIVRSLLLINDYGLKSADAIHLATANNFGERFKPWGYEMYLHSIRY